MAVAGGAVLTLLVVLVGYAPKAVVPGGLPVARMQTFAQAWWWLVRCLLRVEAV
jgi:hypothetical protein